MASFRENIGLRILKSPVLWGLVVTGVFYALLHSGVIQSAMMNRYFTDSSIEYVETGMFFIGLMVLLFKWQGIATQKRWMAQQESAAEPFLGKVPLGGSTPQDAMKLLEQTRQLPGHFLKGYFFARLANALDFIVRNRSAVGFEDEMKYLSDMDANRMGQSYSFIRVIIWAIPILGFLGTVMGITIAIGELGGNLSDTESTLPKMIAGLSVAFDTTALALAFSIVLMFLQFFVEQGENALLDRVDFQVHRELSGRFESIPHTPEGMVMAMRTMGDSILNGLDQQARRQAAVWENAFHQVELEWTRRLESLGENVAGLFQKGMENAGTQLAGQLTGQLGGFLSVELEKQLKNTIGVQWMSHVAEIKDVQKILSEQSQVLAEALAFQREQISRAGEILAAPTQQLMEIHGILQNLVGMQNVLAQNLSTLQGARNFEHTVAELATATSTLSEWLGEVKASRK